MHKILVPVDFSDIAQNALIYSFRVADAIDAEILIYHIYNPGSLETQNTPALISEAMQSGKNTLEQRLQNEIDLARKKTGLKELVCNIKVRAGFMVEASIELVREYMPDMIVMGTGGAKRSKSLFGNSHTSKIIEEINIPVLAIPREMQYEKIKKIAFATAINPGDKKVIDKLLDFAGWFNAEIHTFHICRKKESDCLKDINELEKAYCDFVIDKFIFFDLIEGNNVLESINEFVRNKEIDILVMLTQKRSFFERIFKTSYTRKMALNCKIPLLAYHA